MPLTTKAIRFKSLNNMLDAIELDGPYQQRHLILKALPYGEELTRKELAEITGIPVSAIPIQVSRLLSQGIVTQEGESTCEVTGKRSGLIKLNPDYKGSY